MPKEIAQQVGEELARDKLMRWLQPKRDELAANIERIVQLRQDSHDELTARRKGKFVEVASALVSLGGALKDASAMKGGGMSATPCRNTTCWRR